MLESPHKGCFWNVRSDQSDHFAFLYEPVFVDVAPKGLLQHCKNVLYWVEIRGIRRNEYGNYVDRAERLSNNMRLVERHVVQQGKTLIAIDRN